MMALKVTIFVVISVASTISNVKAVCPLNAQQAQFAVTQCTLPLTGNTNYTVEGAYEFCSSSAAGIMSCLEGLLAECENVSQDAILAIHLIVDLNHLNRTLDVGCENVSLIQMDGECVEQQMNTTAVCLQNELNDYIFKVRALQSDVSVRGFEWLENEQKKAVCRYTQAIGGCADHYLVNCNKNVYDVYHSFLTAFRAPNCEQILSKTVTGSSTGTDGCPVTSRDGLAALTRCTLPLVPLTTFDTGLPSALSMKAFCSTSAEETVTCLKKLQECGTNHPDLRQVIARTLDIKGLLSFLYLSCVNVNLLSSQQKCVEQYSSTVNGCARAEYSVFSNEVLALRSQATVRGVQWFQQNLLQSSCRYSEKLLTCIKPYKYDCNYELGIIYERLILSARSPACASLVSITTTSTTAALPLLENREFF